MGAEHFSAHRCVESLRCRVTILVAFGGSRPRELSQPVGVCFRSLLNVGPAGTPETGGGRWGAVLNVLNYSTIALGVPAERSVPCLV